jgi:dTDP-4-dehydrorhamnose reductase
VIYSWTPMEAAVASSSGKPLNFGSWFVRQLLAGKEVRIVVDQVASPTLADDLASALLALSKSHAQGVFHTAGATPLSRFDFCLQMARRLGLSTDLVHPVQSSELNQAAARPKDSSLRSDRLRLSVGYAMKDLEASLEIFARQMAADPSLPRARAGAKS